MKRPGHRSFGYWPLAWLAAALFTVIQSAYAVPPSPAPVIDIVPGDSSVYVNFAKVLPNAEVEWIDWEIAPDAGGPWTTLDTNQYINYKGQYHHTVGHFGGLVNDTTYFFRVRLQNFLDEYSDYSNVAAGTPVPHPTRAVPRIEGAWWKIAEYAPDVTPYNTAQHNACDFSIWRDDAGNWHCVSCIRDTSYPGRTRFFYHWESPNITDTDWSVDKRVFWTSGTAGTPDAFGRQLENTPHITEGRMQAPHCFKEDGLYYFFYNNAGCYLLSSPDGDDDTFDYQYGYDSHLPLFAMGRDVMIFDNRAHDGLWYAYYTSDTSAIDGQGGVDARSASSLLGPWSGVIPCDVDGFMESPFVVYRHGSYYNFVPCTVWASDDLLDFSGNFLTHLVDENGESRAAIEIVTDATGNDYIAGYGNGIWLARLEWTLPDTSLVITTSSFPNANEGVPYNATIAALGGVTPYSWAIASGSLPDGLSINSSTGEISGTSTTPGTSNFTIEVTDSTSPTPQTDTQALSLTVNPRPPLQITTASLPNVGLGVPYNQILQATGGFAPYSWSVLSGSLPNGMSLDSASGVISGTPTMEGVYDFIVQVIDSDTPPAAETQAMGIAVVTVPAAPGDLTALAYSSSRIDLGWTDHSGNEDGFKIERSSDGISGWTQIDTAAADATSYSNTGLLSGATWYYRARAYNINGDSAYTNLAGATTAAVGGGLPVTFVATDEATGAAWRSTSVDKPNDVDGDDAYGSDGYQMFSVEKKSLPGYISAVTDGPNIVRNTYGEMAIDDPALAIAPTVADYNPGKLDLNIADGLEGVFVRIRLGLDKNFCRFGVITGHKTNEMCASIRLALEGSAETTAQIPVSNTIRQHHIFDIRGTAGQTFVLYGTTRTNLQARNAIAGIFFDTGLGLSNPPASPTALTAIKDTATPTSHINLAWVDNSTDECGFKIYRSVSETSGFALIASTAANVAAYANTGLIEGTTYFYRVHAYNLAGDSSAFASASAATDSQIKPVVTATTSGSNIVIAFPTITGKTYILKQNVATPNLEDAGWTNVGLSTTGNGAEKTFTVDKPTSGKIFYTVVYTQ